MTASAEPVSSEKDALFRNPVRAPEARSSAAVFQRDLIVDKISGANVLSVPHLRAPVLQRVQRLYGNRASQQLVERSSALQRRCACGGTCSKCRDEEKPILQRSETIPSGSGTALEPSTRNRLESHYDTDLTDVRVHTNSEAADSARKLDALAYTSGRDIYFASGMYAPSSQRGQRLLAHEAAHVVQQGLGKEPTVVAKSSREVKIGATDDPLEEEAEKKAEEYVSTPQTDQETATKRQPLNTTQRSIQRQPQSPRGGFSIADTVSSLLVHTIAPKSATVFMRKQDGSSYSLTYSVTKCDLESGRTYEGFKDSSGLHVKEKGKDYLLYLTGAPDPALLFFPPTFSIDVSDTGGTSARPNNAGAPSNPASLFQVQVLTPATFQAMTGVSADTLPEGSVVGGSKLPISPIANQYSFDQTGGGAGLLPGLGGASVLSRFPSYPIPPNATGIIWTQVGAGHLTEFSNVGGSMVPRGFRYDLWMNLFPKLRETGLPGSYQNDFLFTLMPNQTIVYRSTTRPVAESFAERLLNTRYDQTYRFPPRAGTDMTVCGTNCINVPADEVTAALGVSPEILTPEGPVNILQAGRLKEGGPFEASQAGRGTAVKEYLAQDDSYFTSRGLTRMGVPPFTPAARGAVGFIKVGGVILMIYAAYRSIERISQTPEAERPRVEMEEAGSWVGGALGSALGSAGAAAIVCLPAGPADFICVLGGFAGGLLLGALGSYGGAAAGGAFSDVLKSTADLPSAMDVMIQVTGTPQERRDYQKFKEVTGMQPPSMLPGGF